VNEKPNYVGICTHGFTSYVIRIVCRVIFVLWSMEMVLHSVVHQETRCGLHECCDHYEVH
jgi:hypothetical protein